MDLLLRLAKNILIVFTLMLFGIWVTDNNFENFMVFCLSAILMNQLMIEDKIGDLD